MQTEFLKWYLILFVLAFILYSIIETKTKEAKTYRKKNLLYCIVSAMVFGVVTLIAYTGLEKNSLYYFIVLQSLLLIIGVLHSHFLYKILPWSSYSSFWRELLFSILIACIGTIFMLFALTFLKLTDHYFLMLSAITWYFIPFIFVQAVHKYMSIPDIDFKKWFYPINQQIDLPTDVEMASPVVITFEFQKRNNDAEQTIFRAKAPLSMQLGRLFYHFINDYNERHPNTPIEVILDENNVYGWIFYQKPQWYKKLNCLDPDETIVENQIKENSVIVCQRVNES